jgi:hypothetical protein
MGWFFCYFNNNNVYYIVDYLLTTVAYLYRHIRLDKNEPFYIGIGSKANYTRAYEKVKRNIVWSRIVSKTGYEVDIVIDDLTWEEACEKEKEFVALYGRKDLGTGSLCNLTDGGEGTVGLIRTVEHRKKLSQANLGKVLNDSTKEKLRQCNLGKKASLKTRQKMSETRKGRITSPIGLQKLLEYNLTPRKLSEETKVKISVKKTGSKHSFETKAKMSQSQKGKTKNQKKVICLTTGVIYNSIREAAKEFNIGHTGLNKQLLGKRKNKFNLTYYNN